MSDEISIRKNTKKSPETFFYIVQITVFGNPIKFCLPTLSPISTDLRKFDTFMDGCTVLVWVKRLRRNTGPRVGKSFFSHVGSCVNRANDLSKSATRGVCMSVKARKRKKKLSRVRLQPFQLLDKRMFCMMMMPQKKLLCQVVIYKKPQFCSTLKACVLSFVLPCL